MIKESIWMLRHSKRVFSPFSQISGWSQGISGWIRFWGSYNRYNQLSSPENRNSPDYLYPCLGDDTSETILEPTYFYQDAWAFEKIVEAQPSCHFDVGSQNKFVALLSKVFPVTMVDIRPLSLPLKTINFVKGSILELPFEDGSIESLSSLCVVEHIGLGRYGDSLDPLGTEKAVAELKRVVKPGGNLYVSLPLDDDNRTYFNAHRAFSEEYVLKLFDQFELVEARYIYGNDFGEQLKSGFGTGCYHFRRLFNN
jgi:SAM-dependent methyltransferase